MFDWLDEIFTDMGDWFSSGTDAAESSVGSAVNDGFNVGVGSGFDSAGWGVSGAGAGLAGDWASSVSDSWMPDIGSDWLSGSYGDAAMNAGADVGGGITADVGGGAGLSVGGAGIDYGGMDTGVGSGFNSATWGGDQAGGGSSILDQLKSKAGKVDLAGAGMKLGAQALGSLAKGAGSDEMESYLNDVKSREAATQKYNMNMADKKAAVGDSLVTSANAMDPNYYATQQQNATKNRDAAAWAENEANMRTRGADENAVAAERNRAGLTSSMNQGTSYDAGYQTGTNVKNATLGTAGANYTQVSQPTAGLSTAYSQLANSDSQAQKGWGNAIEQAFGITNSTTKKATE